jgi:hypothetical protein
MPFSQAPYSSEHLDKLREIVQSLAIHKKSFVSFPEEASKKLFSAKIEEALALYLTIDSIYNNLAGTLKSIKDLALTEFMWEECWLKLKLDIADDEIISRKDDFIKQELRFLNLLIELVEPQLNPGFQRFKQYFQFKVKDEKRFYQLSYTFKNDNTNTYFKKLNKLSQKLNTSLQAELMEKFNVLIMKSHIFTLFQQKYSSLYNKTVNEHSPFLGELIHLENQSVELEKESELLLDKFSQKTQPKKTHSKNTKRKPSRKKSNRSTSASLTQALEPSLSALEETQTEMSTLSVKEEIPAIPLKEEVLMMLTSKPVADERPGLVENSNTPIHPLYQTYQNKKEQKNKKEEQPQEIKFSFKSRSKKVLENLFEGSLKIKYTNLVTLVENALYGKEVSNTGSSSRKLIVESETIFLHARHHRDRKDFVDPNTIKEVKRMLQALGITPETVEFVKEATLASTTQIQKFKSPLKLGA